MSDYRRFNRYLAAVAAMCCIMVGANLNVQAATLANGSQSYRVNVLNAVGVADSSYLSNEPCTRADFARLMVLSSTLKDSTDIQSQSAVTKDVPAAYAGSGYIKAALSNGWMRTRLGGTFAPNDQISLNEAIRAVLKALGYEDADMGSDVANGRLNMYKTLDINEGIAAVNGGDKLSKQDALNIIYNLLRTKTKDGGSIYGSAIKLSASQSGKELDVSEAMEANLTGPILVKSESSLPNVIPFYNDITATYYFNGNNSNGSGKRYLSSQLNNYGWLIIYYNEKSKTVWAYGEDTGNNTYHCIRGTVSSINYTDDNIAAPSSVVINDTEYALNSSDVKFMFSVNGDVKIGDNVILVCKQLTNEDGSEAEYYAIAVVEYYENSSDRYSNVIYAEGAGKYVAVDKNGNVVNK